MLLTRLSTALLLVVSGECLGSPDLLSIEVPYEWGTTSYQIRGEQEAIRGKVRTVARASRTVVDYRPAEDDLVLDSSSAVVANLRQSKPEEKAILGKPRYCVALDGAVHCGLFVATRENCDFLPLLEGLLGPKYWERLMEKNIIASEFSITFKELREW